jgi:isoleucyl-tRNA synthetase
MDAVQQAAAKALEVARDKGAIGSSLDASLTFYVDNELAELLTFFGEELHFLFITSDTTIAPTDDIPKGAIEADGVTVSVVKSQHQKCIRCWHKHESVGRTSEHSELCARCIGNVTGEGEVRLHF